MAERKTFDCIEMKRKGSERVRIAIEGMTREEELAYWARGTAKLLELQQAVRRGEIGSFRDAAESKLEDGQASDLQRP